MIQIQHTLISDDLFEQQFICDLCKCSGQCCVDGESGARWSVCQPAIKLGRKEGVPLYRFLKEPLIRKFGEEWYHWVLCSTFLYQLFSGFEIFVLFLHINK
jgi:hypothetical protein